MSRLNVSASLRGHKGRTTGLFGAYQSPVTKNCQVPSGEIPSR